MFFIINIVKFEKKNIKMRITFISDTHSKHKLIEKDLPGGNLLIHAGDMSSMGYNHEIQDFCQW